MLLIDVKSGTAPICGILRRELVYFTPGSQVLATWISSIPRGGGRRIVSRTPSSWLGQPSQPPGSQDQQQGILSTIWETGLLPSALPIRPSRRRSSDIHEDFGNSGAKTTTRAFGTELSACHYPQTSFSWTSPCDPSWPAASPTGIWMS